jgi:hypothetical protein
MVIWKQVLVVAVFFKVGKGQGSPTWLRQLAKAVDASGACLSLLWVDARYLLISFKLLPCSCTVFQFPFRLIQSIPGQVPVRVYFGKEMCMREFTQAHTTRSQTFLQPLLMPGQIRKNNANHLTTSMRSREHPLPQRLPCANSQERILHRSCRSILPKLRSLLW